MQGSEQQRGTARRRQYAETVATVLLVGCAVVVAVLAVRNQVRDEGGRRPPRLSNWQSLAREGHRAGSDSATVVIVEFADFQCPWCARLRFVLDTIQRRFTDLALVYRHYPLPMTHRYSDSAANAAECAGEQGRFFEFATALYERQGSIGALRWREFAKASGVPDMARFEECIRSSRFQSRVDRDAWVGDSIGILGTPTLIVNGIVLTGAIRAEDLERRVKAAAREARRTR